MTTGQDQPGDDPALRCERCAAGLVPGSGNFYRISVEAVADPAPPTISAEDLAGDLRARIEQLLARLEGSSEEELLEQVYRRITFHLCPGCYREWIRRPAG